MLKKLVDQERLARLAKALDDRAKAAVKAENERALAAEQAIDKKADANAAAIAVINNEESGILAQAKGYVDEKVEEINGAAGALEGRMDTAEADIDALEVKVGHDKVEGEAPQEATGLFAEVDEAKAAAAAAQADVDAIEGRLDNEGGLVDRIEANEVFVAAQPAIDEAQDNRLKALEDANKEGGAVAEAITKVAQDLADFEAEQATKEKAQDDEDARLDQAIKDEASRADAEEKRIVGLVEAEVQTARAAEKANADEMIKQKDANKEGTLANKIAANAAAIAQEAADRATAVSGEATARKNADSALSDRIAVFEANGAQDVAAKEVRLTAAEANIARLDGEDTVEGSVKKQIKDAITEVNGAADQLAGRVKANEDKLAGLENATVKAEIEAAQAAAEKHADDAITALVDSAPDAMNTLNELASAISANKGVYETYVEQHAQAMATMKTELQGEIDTDVAAEAALRKAADNALDGRLDVLEGEGEGSVKKALADAKAHAEAQDTALHTTISAEIDADVKAEADRAKAEEADIRADFAQADADLHDTIKGEMAAVIQSLVAGITEDGKLRIALGGIQGDEVLVIREQEIPFVTDAEIDQIIAGLDAVEGE